MDWVEVIGYQHEVMHTGVLAYLLRGDSGAQVAGALLDGPAVVGVEDVWPEQRLNGSRPIDLAGWVIERDGTRTRLGVETKVDSAWSPGQLTETVPTDAFGVLLAVGYTALAATDGDLAAISPRPGAWRLIRPRRWAEIVREHAGGDRELERYARRVVQEADEHDAALHAVAGKRPVSASEDRDAQTLGHWAYFHEVLDGRNDVAEWERKTLISGPLLTLWVVDHRGGEVGDYLEFMGHADGRRSLNVKTYAPPHTRALDDSRRRLRELLADQDPGEVKQPGAAAKTCTAARWWLDGVSPAQASARADELRERLLVQPAL
jgi:hypothetical protein